MDKFLYTLSASELRSCFVNGEVSAVDLTAYYLRRIASFEPEIAAFLAVFQDRALSQAEKLDKMRKAGNPLGKLAGVPVAVKDNILIKGELATCGSKFLSNFRAPYQATAIDRLEREGAIFIGKTNLDEFAMGSSTESSAFQKSKNPWDVSCTPGGSSGGSGAAVAARMAPLALGSETGGSVRLPAAFCGVVGFKPTYGRVSRYGLVAYGSSLDQIGPFATNVSDIALTMEIIGGPCEKDSTSLRSIEQDEPGRAPTMQGIKIGVPWQFLEGLEEEQKKHFLHSLEILKQLGASVLEVDLSILNYAIAVYYILATAEASTNLARFDGIRYGRRSSEAVTLDQVYDLSKEEGFGPEVKRRILLGTFVLSSGYQDAYYKKAQKVRRLILEGYQRAFASCDLIATPVSPFTAFKIGSIQDPLQMYLQDIYTVGANLAGLPAIGLPTGFSQDGKPLALQLLGPQKRDKKVIHAAALLEQAIGFNRAVPPLVDQEIAP